MGVIPYFRKQPPQKAGPETALLFFQFKNSPTTKLSETFLQNQRLNKSQQLI
jgi:hypothetical protein